MFGPLLLELGTARLGPTDLGGVRRKQVLEILLAARGHPVPKGRLAEHLWEEEAPRNAPAALETHVSILRKHLARAGPEAASLVRTEPGAYRIAVEDADVDLDRFDALVRSARRAGVREARRRIEEAVALVAGEVLEDEPYSSWAQTLRERYEAEVGQALHRAAVLALLEGDHDAARAHAVRSLTSDPLDERACRLAMIASYGAGMQQEAIDAFHRCRELLRRDLGVDPLPETASLYRGILQHEPCSALVARETRSALIPGDEEERLQAVHRYDILDTPPDGAFDRLTALAARFFRVPIATVTIVDRDRIWFKARRGVDVKEVRRDPGLCASAILQYEPYLVSDAATDPRTLENPLVRGELGLRFYAAAPLTTHDGYNLGTINVADREPREVGEEELQTLRDLAAIVIDELELRLAARRIVEEAPGAQLDPRVPWDAPSRNGAGRNAPLGRPD